MKFASFQATGCFFSLITSSNSFSTSPFTNLERYHQQRSPQLYMSDVAILTRDNDTKQQQLPSNGMNNNKNIDSFMGKQGEEEKKIPDLGTIMKMLPKESYDIDTMTSLFYFGVDLVACVASIGFLDLVVTSDLYSSFPLWGQALAVAPLQVLAGFALWCMWCIGHDAGHGTVSKKNWINHIVGEMSHSIFCLTPFVPWQKSHLKHHLNHNHLTRDYSHQWFIREEADDLHPLFDFYFKTRNIQAPFLYLIYLLLGVPDGGHVFFYGKMWDGEPMKEKIRAAVSVAVSMTTALSLWARTMGTADFAVVCFVPWLVLSFWLFMVTYLQHHSDDGNLYTDDTWTFTKGAFQTVDRDYGKWINRMSHHMVCFYFNFQAFG